MKKAPAFPHRACVAVFLIISASLVRASNPPAPEDGYHMVKGIKVKDSVGPRLHGEPPSNGTYNPENMDLGRTSSFANKAFSTQDSALSKSSTAAEASGDHVFPTKPFATGVKSNSAMNFNQAYPTSTYDAGGRGTDDLHKSFATTSSKITQDKSSPFPAKTSDFQGRTAVMENEKNVPYAGFSPLNDKTFLDPAMKNVHRDPYASENGLDVAHMVDLPNRPLTIDEVRNLINHETIPNLNEKPDVPTKALNDPDYEPPTAAPMAHGDTAPPGPDEKEDGLPSPGMMATPPENSQPLPK
jgi:hypothetical protein